MHIKCCFTSGAKFMKILFITLKILFSVNSAEEDHINSSFPLLFTMNHFLKHFQKECFHFFKWPTFNIVSPDEHQSHFSKSAEVKENIETWVQVALQVPKKWLDFWNFTFPNYKAFLKVVLFDNLKKEINTFEISHLSR